MKSLFTILERHLDGSLWYHSHLNYKSKAEAEKRAQASFSDRPWWIIEYEADDTLPNQGQSYNMMGVNGDGWIFGFGGIEEFTLKVLNVWEK